MARVTFRLSRGEAPPEARALRRSVFVEEQGVAPQEEWDAHDAPGAEALHLLAFEDERAVGCARLRTVGDTAKVERVAVLPERRRRGVGRALMAAAERAAARHGRSRLLLHSQLAALAFYEALGWQAEGQEFTEAGIPHRRMWKHAAPP